MTNQIKLSPGCVSTVQAAEHLFQMVEVVAWVVLLLDLKEEQFILEEFIDANANVEKITQNIVHIVFKNYKYSTA